jgi:hypothetical protein
MDQIEKLAAALCISPCELIPTITDTHYGTKHYTPEEYLKTARIFKNQAIRRLTATGGPSLPETGRRVDVRPRYRIVSRTKREWTMVGLFYCPATYMLGLNLIRTLTAHRYLNMESKMTYDAHRRLMRKLPEDLPYKKTIFPGFWAALRELFRGAHLAGKRGQNPMQLWRSAKAEN